MVVKVFINGFGTIGKRVAFAVMKQDDMKLIGIAKRTPDYKALVANKVGIPIFVENEDMGKKFEEHGIKVAGLIEDAIKEADIVVDAAPKGIGKKNKEVYQENGKKAIFQGGEDESIAEVSFVAQVNYEKALGKKYLRVVSCNTTGLSRVIHTLRSVAPVKSARVILIRRAADPWEVKKGPINAIVPSLKIPSHHAPDAKTVLGDLDIMSFAVVVPTTIMHLHILNVRFEGNVSEDDIRQALEDAPRIVVVPADLKLDSTAALIELARDLGRLRNDLYEVMVFDRSIRAFDNELWICYAVHQEAIVVPENIDAIRAAMRIIEEPERSIKKTDESLGIIRRL